jgi:hypothetical protein
MTFLVTLWFRVFFEHQSDPTPFHKSSDERPLLLDFLEPDLERLKLEPDLPDLELDFLEPDLERLKLEPVSESELLLDLPDLELNFLEPDRERLKLEPVSESELLLDLPDLELRLPRPLPSSRRPTPLPILNFFTSSGSNGFRTSSAKPPIALPTPPSELPSVPEPELEAPMSKPFPSTKRPTPLPSLHLFTSSGSNGFRTLSKIPPTLPPTPSELAELEALVESPLLPRRLPDLHASGSTASTMPFTTPPKPESSRTSFARVAKKPLPVSKRLAQSMTNSRDGWCIAQSKL